MPFARVQGAFAGAFLDLLKDALPFHCALCGGTSRKAVCEPCRLEHLGNIVMPCAQCGAPLQASSRSLVRCGACLADPPAFDATIAVSTYAPPVDGLVRALKFEGELALAPYVGELIAENAWRTLGAELPDVLVPVPLGPRRLAHRGFNQALEIARSTAAALRVELAPRAIRRVRETEAQTLVGAAERQSNLRGAFAASGSPGGFRNLHVGVVDDVMTTGATLQEMAVTLKALGASRVTNLVFARTTERR